MQNASRIAIPLTVLSLLCFSLSSWADTSSQYKSLKEYCLASKADTPENCTCGQATADKIMTPEEQKLVLGLMTQDPNAMTAIMQSGFDYRSLMKKIEQVTAGCA